MIQAFRGFVLACVLAVSFPLAAAAQDSEWLSYSPAIARLRGRIIMVAKYGKPSYGEDPEKDEKLTVPILVLQMPARVRPKQSTSANNETMTNISFVQLIVPPELDAEIKKNLDREALIAGTLAIGRRGGEFTDVVMTVKAVNPTGRPVLDKP
jgi:hypothetical protein